MLIISIVPRLPPAIDGVGDYALNLAQQLRLDFGIDTLFLVGDPNFPKTSHLDGFRVERVFDTSAECLLSTLQNHSKTSVAVLLHYVGYGYAQRGCPYWLVKGLASWKHQFAQARLVTMFHELYYNKRSFAALSRSGFWLSPIQKRLAIHLAKLSDSCVTSRNGYARELSRWQGDNNSEIPVLPVISNIGEPKESLPLAERQRRLVIFGRSGSKRRVYWQSLQSIKQACQILEIQEILDIGPVTGLSLGFVGKIPIIEIGEKPSSEVSKILLDSKAGFLSYNCDYLAKSGIFAAYSAHGLLIINDQGSSQVVDGLQARKHYLVANKRNYLADLSENIQIVADNAYEWYLEHKLNIHSSLLYKLFVNY